MKQQWVADDGEVFDSEEQCLAYEQQFAWFVKYWNGYKMPNGKWVSGIVDKGDVCNGKFVLTNLSKFFDITVKKPNGTILNPGNHNEQAGQANLNSTQQLFQNAPTPGEVSF